MAGTKAGRKSGTELRASVLDEVENVSDLVRQVLPGDEKIEIDCEKGDRRTCALVFKKDMNMNVIRALLEDAGYFEESSGKDFAQYMSDDCRMMLTLSKLDGSGFLRVEIHDRRNRN